MSFLIGLLTVVLVLDCILLILLVLIQLPKKDAGAGLAFGGGTTDALFGAGSGNALTKITKYAAGVFFALAILLSMLQSHYYHRDASRFKEVYQQQQNQPAPGAPAPKSPAAVPGVTNAPAIQLTIPTNAATGSTPHN